MDRLKIAKHCCIPNVQRLAHYGQNRSLQELT